MNEKEWNIPQEPWEQNYYQTGSTRPPKNRGGCIAVLLALVILLGGIVTVLSLLNVRLFKTVTTSESREADLGFQAEESVEGTAPTEGETVASHSDTDVTIELNSTPQAIENIPQQGGLSLQEIYTKAIASVVSISCNTGTGTGVVISADGCIVTNCHVVEKATSIEVLLTDGRTLPARLVGMDSVSDLAVLDVQATDLIAAEFGDSGSVRVGDAVVAIGDPLGIALRGTMTDGIVSAINRDITTGGRTMTLIQTNAALNSGNSGGPLLNCYGQVIGINTMKIGDYMNASGVEGLGFAIPSTTVKEVVDQLVSQGYVSGRPALGITGQELSSFDMLYYRLPQGIYITAVEQTSDAAAKGIAPGDVLLEFNGTRITSSDTLLNALYSCQAGDTVSVVVYRSGSQYTVDVTLGEAQ